MSLQDTLDICHDYNLSSMARDREDCCAQPTKLKHLNTLGQNRVGFM
jgi:hypothetical protein